DPAYPAQLHVDYRWHDSLTARTALTRAKNLGAIRLPQLGGAEVYADPASHPFCIQNEIPTIFDIAGLYLNPRAPRGADGSSGGERPSPPPLSQQER
ncbi:MAG: hypothetical protein ACRDQA_25320, partial [Nocardioidaceae bacterium]